MSLYVINENIYKHCQVLASDTEYKFQTHTCRSSVWVRQQHETPFSKNKTIHVIKMLTYVFPIQQYFQKSKCPEDISWVYFQFLTKRYTCHKLGTLSEKIHQSIYSVLNDVNANVQLSFKENTKCLLPANCRSSETQSCKFIQCLMRKIRLEKKREGFTTFK